MGPLPLQRQRFSKTSTSRGNIISFLNSFRGNTELFYIISITWYPFRLFTLQSILVEEWWSYCQIPNLWLVSCRHFSFLIGWKWQMLTKPNLVVWPSVTVWMLPFVLGCKNCGRGWEGVVGGASISCLNKRFCNDTPSLPKVLFNRFWKFYLLNLYILQWIEG